MVTLGELRKKEEKIVYVRVPSTNVDEHHVRAVRAVGVEHDLLVQKAYAEVAAQAERELLLKKNPVMNEVIPKMPERGEFLVQDDRQQREYKRMTEDENRIVAFLDKPGQNFYAEEISDVLRIEYSWLSRILKRLEEKKVITRIYDNHKKRIFLTKHGDPNLEEFVSMNGKISSS